MLLKKLRLLTLWGLFTHYTCSYGLTAKNSRISTLNFSKVCSKGDNWLNCTDTEYKANSHYSLTAGFGLVTSQTVGLDCTWAFQFSPLIGSMGTEASLWPYLQKKNKKRRNIYRTDISPFTTKKTTTRISSIHWQPVLQLTETVQSLDKLISTHRVLAHFPT